MSFDATHRRKPKVDSASPSTSPRDAAAHPAVVLCGEPVPDHVGSAGHGNAAAAADTAASATAMLLPRALSASQPRQGGKRAAIPFPVPTWLTGPVWSAAASASLSTAAEKGNEKGGRGSKKSRRSAENRIMFAMILVYLFVQSRALVGLLVSQQAQEACTDEQQQRQQHDQADGQRNMAAGLDEKYKDYKTDPIDTCAFRRYPSRRYYHLDAPRSWWPDFLAGDSYIYGEAPVVLRSDDGGEHGDDGSDGDDDEKSEEDDDLVDPSSLASRATEKLCIDQSAWYPGHGFGPHTHPFNDGTNPSILRIADNPLLDETYAAELRSMLPADARFLVVMCMTKSICSWGETDDELREHRVADYLTSYYQMWEEKFPPFLRTTFLVLDKSFRTVAQFHVNVTHDAQYVDLKKYDDDVDSQQAEGHFRSTQAELDDPRLFTYDGKIHVSYLGKSHYLMVHQPLHLSIVDGKLSGTVKASEVTLPCCGRNMAFLDRRKGSSGGNEGINADDRRSDDADAAAGGISQDGGIDGRRSSSTHKPRPQVVTWLDPLTVEDAADLVVSEPFKVRDPGTPGETKAAGKARSHIHGTNGFVLHVPQTDEFLTIGHFHRPYRNEESEYSKFGHHYTHAWITIAADSADGDGDGKYSIRRVSPEFVFPSQHRPHDAEIIQFASGLEWMDDEVLVVTYGINDCEGAATTVSWSQVDLLLRPVRKGQEVVDLMMPLKPERGPSPILADANADTTGVDRAQLQSQEKKRRARRRRRRMRRKENNQATPN